MARATNDLAAVRQIVGPMILYSFQAIFALAISLPIMLNISVKLTLLLLIPMPLVFHPFIRHATHLMRFGNT